MNREDLIARERAGEALAFVFFWGHTAKKDAVGKECFSQWYPAPFSIDGVTYPTAEHWMMVGKARVCGDEAIVPRMLAAATPNEVKALGREVTPYDDAAWARARFDWVRRGNLAKFTQHPALRAFLVGTAPRILVEAAPNDRVWGIGLAQDDARAHRPSTWLGENLLGFALMSVREELSR